MIHIACNIDSNYVRHCAVTLVSLFENNRKEQITAHIIARDLSDAEKKILIELADGESFQQLDVRFVETNQISV
jgi:lipopolysaccharide biosynthesis glycosyltransferase